MELLAATATTSSSDSAVALAALGIVSVLCAALIWILKYVFKELKPALLVVSKSVDHNTAATKAADKYLRERNGRDNEFQIENIAAIRAIPTTMQGIADAQKEAIIRAVTVKNLDAKNAHVGTMIVDHKEDKK